LPAVEAAGSAAAVQRYAAEEPAGPHAAVADVAAEACTAEAEASGAPHVEVAAVAEGG